MVQSQCDLERDLKDPLAEEERSVLQFCTGTHLYGFLCVILCCMPCCGISDPERFGSALI